MSLWKNMAGVMSSENNLMVIKSFYCRRFQPTDKRFNQDLALATFSNYLFKLERNVAKASSLCTNLTVD